MLRYGMKKHTSQDELSAGRSSHGYVKNTVLMNSGTNNPRLNKVGDVFLPQAATWAELGKKPQISLLCGPKPQEDNRANELTRDRAWGGAEP